MDIESLKAHEIFFEGGFYGEAVRQLKLCVLRAQPTVQAKVDRHRKSLVVTHEEVIGHEFGNAIFALRRHNTVSKLGQVTLEQFSGVLQESTQQAAQELQEIGVAGLMEMPSVLSHLPEEAWLGITEFYNQAHHAA